MGDEHRTVIMPFIPTENLAKWAFDQVDPLIKSSYGNSLLEPFTLERPPNHGQVGSTD